MSSVTTGNVSDAPRPLIAAALTAATAANAYALTVTSVHCVCRTVWADVTTGIAWQVT